MSQAYQVVDNSIPSGACESSWGFNKCPNTETFVLVMNDIKGGLRYAIMCEPHLVRFAEGYTREFVYRKFDFEFVSTLNNRIMLEIERRKGNGNHS